MHTLDLSTQEAEAGELWFEQDQPVYIVSFMDSWDHLVKPCLNLKTKTLI